jgi:2-polyprenyl-3-methyl-5-hydroxy-6-metoxy-1,4-benzoquinol methylase
MDDFKYPEPDPNKKSAADVWNARYAGDKYLYGKEPVLSLKNHLSVLRKGRALDVGMGEGRNVAYLAQNGFQVEGIDCSSVAVEKAKKLAAEKGVTVDVKSQNLDFFLMPLMKYDTILMTYFRPQARFFSEIRRGLVNGGTFLLEAYTVEQAKAAPNPNLDFEECYKPNEVLGHLKDFQVLFYKEIPDRSAHTVQLIARKVAPR